MLNVTSFFKRCCGCLPGQEDNSVFTPNGLSMGIGFDTFGKTFFYVGKLSGSDRNVLCISDWSKPANNDLNKSEFLVNIQDHGVDIKKFTLVNIQEGPYKPFYAISDSAEIVAMIDLIQANNIDTEELIQLKSEHLVLLSKSKLVKK